MPVQTPCEKKIYKVLPTIRKELVCRMVHDYKLTQKEASEKLGITPAAVSQYRCRKRAKDSITNEEVLNQIDKSAKSLIEQGSSIAAAEICKICCLLHKEEQ